MQPQTSDQEGAAPDSHKSEMNIDPAKSQQYVDSLEVMKTLSAQWQVAHGGVAPRNVYLLEWTGAKNPADVLINGIRAERFGHDYHVRGDFMGRTEQDLGLFARAKVFQGPNRDEQMIVIATDHELETSSRTGSPHVAMKVSGDGLDLLI